MGLRTLSVRFSNRLPKSKANAAIDALSRFAQRIQSENKKIRTENTLIFHQWQSLLTKVHLAGLTLLSHHMGSQTKVANCSLPKKIHICRTYVLSDDVITKKNYVGNNINNYFMDKHWKCENAITWATSGELKSPR